MPSPEHTCKSCEVRISNREAIYNCVGCHESMHLKLACVGISEAIYGLMQISRKVLIFCNDCVRKNQRDIFLDTIASHQDKSVARSFFEEVKQGMRDNEDKNDVRFSSAGTVVVEMKVRVTSIGFEMNTTTTHNEQTQENSKLNIKNQSSNEDYDGIRILGIPELKSEKQRNMLNATHPN